MAENVKDVLAAIKKTQGLRDKIIKESGFNKNSSSIQLDNMYLFEYKNPNYESKNWLNLHGKCIGDGQKDLRESGYEFIQIDSIDKSDIPRTGTKCRYCGEALDSKAFARYKESQTSAREARRAEYLEEKAIRAEWETEQILLGKM